MHRLEVENRPDVFPANSEKDAFLTQVKSLFEKFRHHKAEQQTCRQASKESYE
jgi:hypothetical protein